MSPPVVSHAVQADRVAACAATPSSGPRLVFLSGGSALRATSRALKRLTHNSVHLITPFDSGGSSARLRDALNMCAVGDLRNRLIALADDGPDSAPGAVALLSHRLPTTGDNAKLRALVEDMGMGRGDRMERLPVAQREVIAAHLATVLESLPNGFDFTVASIGNLVMAGAYLSANCDLHAAVDLTATLLRVRGTVRPVVTDDLHLVATLADGSTIVGQHAITSEAATGRAKIVDLHLVDSIANATPMEVAASAETEHHIERSDGICFPMGSFFSSVVANILPRGIGAAIARASVPKIFIPNMVGDVELRGMSAADAVDEIVRRVRHDAEAHGQNIRAVDAVTTVVLDTDDESYADLSELERIASEGITVVRAPLVHPTEPNRICPKRLSELLVSLVPTGAGDRA